MLDFFIRKYGTHVCKKLITNDLFILRNNVCKSQIEEQQAVTQHLSALTKINGDKLIPHNLITSGIEWGFDCSGWLGRLEHNKNIMVIGTEPNIDSDYKIVYDFGHERNKTLEEVAIKQFNYKYNKKNRTRDISKIIVDIFYDNPTTKDIVNTLNSCYLTDMCFFAPKESSDKTKIANKLRTTKSFWNSLTKDVADLFLIEEIELIKPKIIISSSKVPADFFEKKLRIKYDYQNIINSKLRIGMTEWKGIKMLSLPHLSGQTRNKLYAKKEQSSFNHVKTMVRNFIK